MIAALLRTLEDCVKRCITFWLARMGLGLRRKLLVILTMQRRDDEDSYIVLTASILRHECSVELEKTL